MFSHLCWSIIDIKKLHVFHIFAWVSFIYMCVAPFSQTRHIHHSLPPEISWVFSRLSARPRSNVLMLSACFVSMKLGCSALFISSTLSSVSRWYCRGIARAVFSCWVLLCTLEGTFGTDAPLAPCSSRASIYRYKLFLHYPLMADIATFLVTIMIDSPVNLENRLQTTSVIAGPRPPPLNQGYTLSDKLCILYALSQSLGWYLFLCQMFLWVFHYLF